MGDEETQIDSRCCVICGDGFESCLEKALEVQCTICLKSYHYKCTEVPASDKFAKKNLEKGNWTYSCGNCKEEKKYCEDMVRKMNVIGLYLEKMFDKFDNLEQEVVQMKEILSMKSSGPTGSTFSKRRYADVIREASNETVQSPKIRRGNALIDLTDDGPRTPVLVISQKVTSDVISVAEKNVMKEKVKKSVNPASDPVVSYSETARGKIVVRCDEKADVESVRQKIQHEMGDEYEVSLPSEVTPMIKVVGLSDSEDTVSIVDKIIKQNGALVDVNAKIECVNVYLRNKTYSAILKVDTKTFRSFMYAGRLNIGWSRCRVFEYFNNVRRCFKCCDYTHFSKDCKAEVTTCGRCAGQHEEKDCDGETRKCINCVRMNEKLGLDLDVEHAVFDLVCPVYAKKTKIARERTRYKQ